MSLSEQTAIVFGSMDMLYLPLRCMKSFVSVCLGEVVEVSHTAIKESSKTALLWYEQKKVLLNSPVSFIE